nr:NAD/NADP-dependent octopine/nopaline dehydrogenase family protein [Pigmentibacter ruber]
MKNIAVLGCGHGGQALAGHLALLGLSVNLYAHPNHLGGLNIVKSKGGIDCQGTVQGFGKLNCITTDLNLAIKDTDIVFICLPVVAHESIFINLLPYLQENHIVVNLSAQFSGIFQKEILNRSNWEKNIIIADVTSFPYACRCESPGQANIVSIKQSMGIASYNYNLSFEVASILNKFFPSKLRVMSSFIEVGLYDPCGVTHPANVLFNAGRIGNNLEFYFYKDGITKETASFLEKLDEERIEIGLKLKLNLPKFYEVMNEYYELSFNNIYDFYKLSPIHNKKTFCPAAINHRYITEDVPYSLVPWLTIGEALGVKCSAMRNIVEISSLLNNTNYFEKGRIISEAHLREFHKCG